MSTATVEIPIHQKVTTFLGAPRKMLIGGRWLEAGPWRTLPASERGRLIWKLADLVESHLEEFAQLESLDNGKPVGVARAADVPLAVDLFRYMAGWATKIEGNPLPISVPYTPGA